MQATAVQPAFAGKRLMWIDDRVSVQRSLIERFEERGVAVTPLESVEDALVSLSQHAFDSVLLDAMIGHESSLPAIPLILERADGANFNVCSGFMYRERLQEERRRVEEQTGQAIGTIDKLALPDPDEPKPIDHFLNRIFSHGEIEETKAASSIIPKKLSLSYEEYDKLSFEDRMFWLGASESLIRETADRYFALGHVYLLFFGDTDRPAIATDNHNDIPSEEEVLLAAQRAGFAPLVIHNVGAVDDIPANCCGRLQAYPTLLVSAIRGETEEVHFDTGASRTLMSYEWYAEKGWIPLTRAPGLIFAGEMTVPGVRYVLPSCDFIDERGSKLSAPFEAYYLIDWWDTRFSLKCEADCRNNWSQDQLTQTGAKYCRFRTGLLGRSLPRESLKVDFSINFASGRVRFVQ